MLNPYEPPKEVNGERRSAALWAIVTPLERAIALTLCMILGALIGDAVFEESSDYHHGPVEKLEQSIRGALMGAFGYFLVRGLRLAIHRRT